MVTAVNDVDGGDGGVPVAGDDENGIRAARIELLPRLQEVPRRNRFVDRQFRRSMGYGKRILQFLDFRLLLWALRKNLPSLEISLIRTSLHHHRE